MFLPTELSLAYVIVLQKKFFWRWNVHIVRVGLCVRDKTRQVYNLFQEPVEQPPLGFSITEEKNQTVRICFLFPK